MEVYTGWHRRFINTIAMKQYSIKFITRTGVFGQLPSNSFPKFRGKMATNMTDPHSNPQSDQPETNSANPSISTITKAEIENVSQMLGRKVLKVPKVSSS